MAYFLCLVFELSMKSQRSTTLYSCSDDGCEQMCKKKHTFQSLPCFPRVEKQASVLDLQW